MRWLRRLPVRLLAFNVMLVFLPVGGVLVLDTYESHLLEAQERTMGQEGRLLAAAIEATGDLRSTDATRILVQLGQRHLARLRVVTNEGKLLADSASLGPRRESSPEASTPPSTPIQESWLYRLGSLPFRLLRGELDTLPEDSPDRYDAGAPFDGPELESAFSGRYGATTRISPGPTPSVILFIAIPIRIDGVVDGAVLVSQSTSRILSALYAVRLDVFRVFLASFAAAVVLSLLFSTTIARPLNRLRRKAEAMLDRRGRLRDSFEASDRRDEIGDLERALAELTRRLEDHLVFTEGFAADLAHELKNPLGSIRSAADMARDEEDPEQRRRFLEMILRDVSRVERLLSGAREISRIDMEIEDEERTPVRLDDLLTQIAESFRLRTEVEGLRIVLALAHHDVVISASADRLTQALENLIENAISFSPTGASVTISLQLQDHLARIAISDEGPGIPDGHSTRIFNRFFSYRPQNSDGNAHLGLGLAVVKSIVEAYGGSVRAANRETGGAVFLVQLPLL